MKKSIAKLCLVVIASTQLFAESDTKKLEILNSYGINKCDKFILSNGPSFVFNNSYVSHKIEIGNDMIGASIIETIELKSYDTAKIDSTYLQSQSGCYLTQRTIYTKLGTCNQYIDTENWEFQKDLSTKNYLTFKSKYAKIKNVLLYARVVYNNDTAFCLQETVKTTSSPLEK